MSLKQNVERIVQEAIEKSMMDLIEGSDFLWNLSGGVPISRRLIHINPGRKSGKTRFIAKNVNPQTDLVVLNNISSVEYFCEKMEELGVQKFKPYDFIITPSSSIQGRSLTANRVWVDEPTLCHFHKMFPELVAAFNAASRPTFIVLGE